MQLDELLALGFAGSVGAVLFTLLVGWERRGKPGIAVALVLGSLVVESALWGAQQDVGAGLFKLAVGGYSVRVPDLLIPAALAARLVVRGRPRRIGWPALWLVLWCVWYAAAAVVGLVEGHEIDEVFFEAKAIIYLGGAFALAVGVPVRDYVSGRGLERLAYATAGLAVVLAVMSTTGRFVSVALPGIRSPAFGHFGADTASLYAAIGLALLLVELTRRPPRLAVMVTGGLLVISVLFAEQRAAILGIVVSIGVVGIAWTGTTARARFRVTPTELGVVALVLVAVALLPVVVSGLVGDGSGSVLFRDSIDSTFFTEQDSDSAAHRVEQFNEVREVIAERPLTGFGLAYTYRYFATGTNRWLTTPMSHNVVTDLLFRTGVVGLVLFAVPVVMVLAGGIAAWRRADDPRVAALALACVAVAAGLLAKGQVESIFEKFRLAVLLGLALGAARSAATERLPNHRRSPGRRVPVG